MFIEGKGWRKPKPVTVMLTQNDNLHHFWIVGRTIATQKGYKVENYVTGALGEAAVSKRILQTLGIPHLCNSLQLYHYGDGGVDITINNKTIQIKTSKLGNYVKRLTGSKKFLPLKADLFVFVEPNSDIHNPNFVTMKIKGWCFLKELTDYGEIKRSKFDESFDLWIEDKYLFPISQLESYLGSI